MCTGFADALTPIGRFVEWFQPRTVVDVGVGGGRMGFLAREYGHHPWHPRARGEGVHIVGIEGYEPYITDVQRALYDDLLIGDALETLGRLASEGRRFDLAIASDIIEHFEHADGLRLVESCLAVADVLLVATPRGFFDQTSEDNELQEHRSFWPEHELLRAGATAVLHRDESSVVLFGDRAIAGEYLRSRRPRPHEWVLPPAVRDALRSLKARGRAR